MTTAPTDFAVASISPEAADGVADFDFAGLDGLRRIGGRLVVASLAAALASSAFHDAGVDAVVDGVDFTSFGLDGEVVGGDFGHGSHHTAAHHSAAASAASSTLAAHGRARLAGILWSGFVSWATAPKLTSAEQYEKRQ